MNNNKPLNKSSFDDAVFEGRNKAYGAYELRSLYTKRLLTSFGIAILFVLIVILYPKQKEKPEKKYTVEEVSLTQFKKIKAPILPEKEVEQTVVEKKEVKQNVVEKPTVNEAKVVVVEKKSTTQDIQENKSNVSTPVATTDGGIKAPVGDNSNQGDSGPSDSESVTFPAVFPGCEKLIERKKILDCFSQKLSSEIQFYLENADWKRKSTEKIYFEIDKQGNVNNVKFDGGNKINDVLATETLRKIATDLNKRTNPNRRIKPGKDATGKVVSVKYRLPVTLPDPNVD